MCLAAKQSLVNISKGFGTLVSIAEIGRTLYTKMSCSMLQGRHLFRLHQLACLCVAMSELVWNLTAFL